MDTVLKRAKEILDELITVKVCPSSKDVVSYGDHRKWDNCFSCIYTRENIWDYNMVDSYIRHLLYPIVKHVNSLKTPQFAILGAPDENYDWTFNHQIFGDNSVNLRYTKRCMTGFLVSGHPGIVHTFDVAVRSCPFPMLTSIFK